VGPLIRRVRAPHSAHHAGFTLVEILVVLVVLAIAAATLVAQLDRDPRRVAESEARRLGGALEHAAALAQWTGETLGVSVHGGGYRFWRRASDSRWSAMSGSDVLAPRELPTGISILPGTYAGATLAPDAVLPFRASGRNEPYTLIIAAPQWATVLAADPLNRITLAGFATDAR
jgi:general secretion pathway protein H